MAWDAIAAVDADPLLADQLRSAAVIVSCDAVYHCVYGSVCVCV
jgi:hypothetical protein